MNGLQIIKTLALKIRYASIVEWYNFWSIVLQHHQNIVPTVASIDETIRHITEGNRSISRFGDGEMLLTSPSKSIGFQEGSPLLAKRLREVLVSHEEGHLVAIPDVFSGLNRYRRKCRRFQRTHFFIYGKWWDQLLIPGRKYENAFLSRPYMDYTSKEHCARWFRELKTQKELHFGEEIYVTRKGAVSARAGQYGIIPGSMGAKSFIVRGLGNEESFCSCSHGAGRVMSRTKAKKLFSVEDQIRATAHVECRKDAEVIDEIPMAYKDIDAVMAAQSDLVEVIYTLRQVVCVKG